MNEEDKKLNDSSKNSSKLKLTLDYRIIVGLLLVVIIAMLAVWRPWQDEPVNNDRVVKVTGESTVKATPDEFVFYPNYEFVNKDKAAGLAEVSKKSEEITAKLKELGVAENNIKTDTNGYNYGWYYREETGDNTYSLRFTVTVDNQELAQKVQDYLVTTPIEGAVSPQASFSDAKQKELENQARDEATKDARAKADQSATNIGFKVGKVKSVSDGSGFGDYYPMHDSGANIQSSLAEGTNSSLEVQPGENDLNYSVTVEYYIK